MLLLDIALEILAPTRCAACDERVRPGALFCSACVVSVEAAAGRGAAFAYGGAPATAVARLKYEGRSDLGPRLGAALAEAARVFAGEIDLVVPVPLHPKRLAERGFNQAALLARPVASELGVPHAARALARVQDTPRQATLDRSARAANVREAFRAVARLRGPSVLLVDDVRTTGATLEACSRALVAAGARSVQPLVVLVKE